jgi:hypothetical protein
MSLYLAETSECTVGKPFYGFGSLFMYMVALGLYHGLLARRDEGRTAIAAIPHGFTV